VKAAEAKRPLLMSAVNWGEVYYSVRRARGEKSAGEKLREIAQLPIEVVGVDTDLAPGGISESYLALRAPCSGQYRMESARAKELCLNLVKSAPWIVCRPSSSISSRHVPPEWRRRHRDGSLVTDHHRRDHQQFTLAAPLTSA
jgi:hypothetical protein